jgi:Ureide permease
MTSLLILLLVVVIEEEEEEAEEINNNSTNSIGMDIDQLTAEATIAATSNNNNKIIYIPWVLVWFAIVGGMLLSVGNMTLQWAITVFGASLTIKVAIQASLTVMLGTSINYVLQPSKTSRPEFLGLGVVLFVAAILIATRAHVLYARQWNQQQQQQQQQLKKATKFSGTRGEEDNDESDSDDDDDKDDDDDNIHDDTSSSVAIELSQVTAQRPVVSYISLGNAAAADAANAAAADATTNKVVSPSVDEFHDETTVIEGDDEDEDDANNNKFCRCQHSSSLGYYYSSLTMTAAWTKSQKALALAVGGGCCFGFFSPAFNIAVNDPFHWAPSAPLSVPMANAWFSASFTFFSVIGTWRLMRSPPTGTGMKPLSWQDYTPHVRSWGMLAGFLCGMANALQFQGGRVVGFATADLVQAYPLVSTLWDIFLFGEYRQRAFNQCRNNSSNSSTTEHGDPKEADGATTTIGWLLMIMYILYLGGIACMIASSASSDDA